MKLSAPIPWSLVPAGAVVLLPGDDTPRTVITVTSDRYGSMALLEGAATPRSAPPWERVQLVILDDTDAVAALAAAGLNPEIIGES